MKSKRSRLDRFLSDRLSVSRKDARFIVAQGRVRVDYHPATGVQQLVDEYTHVIFDERVLQNNTPQYIQLNKPAGVVSATKDAHHKTVVDVLANVPANNLHIVGRLDFNTTGLLLLTNDGRWSRRLTDPSNHVTKRYLVQLDKPITEELVGAFCKGIYFPYEKLTTRPALISMREPNVAEVTLVEGRYHQIKRMFGRFDIRVTQLHRFSVGNLVLDTGLAPGESRCLTPQEIDGIFERPRVEEKEK